MRKALTFSLLTPRRHSFLFIFPSLFDDKRDMAISPKTLPLFHGLIVLGLFLSHFLSAEPTIQRKCTQEPVGTWVDLATLNRFEFNSQCGFTFEGANCSVSGDYFSVKNKSRSLLLLNKTNPSHSTCLPKGELSCTFSLQKNGLTLDCPPQQQMNLSRQPPRAVAKEKKLEGSAKTLVLLQQSDTKALRQHLERLSRQYDLEATTALGYNYFYGSRGFKKDYAEALYWNRLAASRGSHAAKVLAGTQYLYGLGVKQDLTRSEEFFLMAAEENDVVPQKALAGLYLMGPQNKQNREKAVFWLTQASQLGDKQAKDFLKSLKPQEVKNIKAFCALFDTQVKPETTAQTTAQTTVSQVNTNALPHMETNVHIETTSPIAASPSFKSEKIEAVRAVAMNEDRKESPKVSEPSAQNGLVRVDDKPESWEPSRCLAAGYIPASSVSHSSEPTSGTSGLFWVGGGLTDLGIKSSADSFNDFRALFSFRSAPISLWGDLKAQAKFDYAMALNSRLKTLSYSQIEGKLHYDISISDGFTLKPTFSYLRLEFEDAVTRLGIVGGQIGVGMGSEIALTETWALHLSAMTLAAGRGSIVSENQTQTMSLIQNNHTLNLFLERKALQSSSYGFGLQLQQISLLGSQQDTIQLSQYSGSFFWNF
jgi:hypothetical protein